MAQREAGFRRPPEKVEGKEKEEKEEKEFFVLFEDETPPRLSLRK